MIIGSVNSTSSLLMQLEANGLSADKAKLVETDLQASQAAASPTIGSAPPEISSTSFRAALEAKINADVSSGKLSARDAAVVKTTLDKIDNQANASDTTNQATTKASQSANASVPAGAAKSGSGGSGGGGGGSSSKTVLSETITVVGSVKTTTITYTDKTTATTTATATDSDKAKYEKPVSTDPEKDVARSYLSTIEPGSLIDKTA